MASNNHAYDPYLAGPDQLVLRNLVGAETYEELSAAESELYHARLLQLRDEELIEPTRDAAEVRALHRHLFQDIYDWAGEYRIINMRRGTGEHFAPFDHIPFLMDAVMTKLADRQFLKGFTGSYSLSS